MLSSPTLSPATQTFFDALVRQQKSHSKFGGPTYVAIEPTVEEYTLVAGQSDLPVVQTHDLLIYFAVEILDADAASFGMARLTRWAPKTGIDDTGIYYSTLNNCGGNKFVFLGVNVTNVMPLRSRKFEWVLKLEHPAQVPTKIKIHKVGVYLSHTGDDIDVV